MILWSVFTAATGYVWNLASLVVARFFFGAGEAGCFPNLTKAFMIWLPNQERTRAHAEHYAGMVRAILSRSAKENGTPGVLCSPFDTELFGHW